MGTSSERKKESIAGEVGVPKPDPLSILKRLWAQGQDDSQGEKKAGSGWGSGTEPPIHPLTYSFKKEKKTHFINFFLREGEEKRG